MNDTKKGYISSLNSLQEVMSDKTTADNLTTQQVQDYETYHNECVENFTKKSDKKYEFGTLNAISLDF